MAENRALLPRTPRVWECSAAYAQPGARHDDTHTLTRRDAAAAWEEVARRRRRLPTLADGGVAVWPPKPDVTALLCFADCTRSSSCPLSGACRRAATAGWRGASPGTPAKAVAAGSASRCPCGAQSCRSFRNANAYRRPAYRRVGATRARPRILSAALVERRNPRACARADHPDLEAAVRRQPRRGRYRAGAHRVRNRGSAIRPPRRRPLLPRIAKAGAAADATAPSAGRKE
ncbi:MAG: hypothetical protein ACLTDR_08485 [Adlercreutzia equolifaciens]